MAAASAPSPFQPPHFTEGPTAQAQAHAELRLPLIGVLKPGEPARDPAGLFDTTGKGSGRSSS